MEDIRNVILDPYKNVKISIIVSSKYYENFRQLYESLDIVDAAGMSEDTASETVELIETALNRLQELINMYNDSVYQNYNNYLNIYVEKLRDFKQKDLSNLTQQEGIDLQNLRDRVDGVAQNLFDVRIGDL